MCDDRVVTSGDWLRMHTIATLPSALRAVCVTVTPMCVMTQSLSHRSAVLGCVQ